MKQQAASSRAGDGTGFAREKARVRSTIFSFPLLTNQLGALFQILEKRR
ncbi:hypothetical protein [Eggerthella guodeyinii]|uniref:Uncharacterized protein n=1 Tax=Eggerthella guodeyinii TaxID=2690837 RepID=A0A6N7RKL3_9ACTN|nr:hypothetical protein [Eggerthella guodeyinii]MRX81799.1 hypothetical protein [Eggerthella guodeyinii]